MIAQTPIATTSRDHGRVALASVETASSLAELQGSLTHANQPCGFEWVRREVAPGAVPLYELHVDSTDSTAASSTGRSLLAQLLDAADRGMLRRFRIVRGADLLLNHRWNDRATFPPFRDSPTCDETARAAQPDIATGYHPASQP